MDVVICGRDDHSRYVAEQYYKNGMLKKYYTFYYYKSNLLGKIIKHIDPSITKKKRVEIPVNYIRNFPVHKLINKAMRFILSFHKERNSISDYISDVAYDLFISLTIPKADIYHLWQQYSYFTLKKIKKKYPNSKVMLEVFSAHPNYREDIYKKNDTASVSSIFIEKMIMRINKEIKLADIVLVSSYHVKESILATINMEEKKIRVIPYGADLTNFYELGSSVENADKAINLLYVGQVGGHKGVNYLVEAYKILRKKYDSKFHLTVIGTVSDEFKRYWKKNKRDICYIGQVPHNELISYYNQADIFVFPSLSESMGMVIAEAMACGLPVITTKNASWIVKDGSTGVIIEENNLEALIESIVYLSSDVKIREKIASNALISAKNYTWKEYFKTLTEVLS